MERSWRSHRLPEGCFHLLRGVGPPRGPPRTSMVVLCHSPGCRKLFRWRQYATNEPDLPASVVVYASFFLVWSFVFSRSPLANRCRSSTDHIVPCLNPTVRDLTAGAPA